MGEKYIHNIMEAFFFPFIFLSECQISNFGCLRDIYLAADVELKVKHKHNDFFLLVLPCSRQQSNRPRSIKEVSSQSRRQFLSRIRADIDLRQYAIAGTISTSRRETMPSLTF